MADFALYALKSHFPSCYGLALVHEMTATVSTYHYAKPLDQFPKMPDLIAPRPSHIMDWQLAYFSKLDFRTSRLRPQTSSSRPSCRKTS